MSPETAEVNRPDSGVFSKDIAEWVKWVSAVFMPLALAAGGGWRYFALTWYLPSLVVYMTIYLLGERLDNRIYSTSADSAPESILHVRDDSQGPPTVGPRRRMLTILACSSLVMPTLAWIVMLNVLYTVPKAGVAVVQLLGQMIAPQLVITGADPRPSLVLPTDEPVTRISAPNPFEQVREAARVFKQESDSKDARIAELERRLAAGSDRRGNAAAPVAPTRQDPPQVAATEPAALPEPQPPAMPQTRELTNDEKATVARLSELIDLGNTLLGRLQSLTKDKLAPPQSLLQEMSFWLSNAQNVVRGDRLLGALVSSDLSQRQNGWSDPLQEMSALVGFLVERRNGLLKPEPGTTPSPPVNLRLTK